MQNPVTLPLPLFVTDGDNVYPLLCVAFRLMQEFRPDYFCITLESRSQALTASSCCLHEHPLHVCSNLLTAPDSHTPSLNPALLGMSLAEWSVRAIAVTGAISTIASR